MWILFSAVVIASLLGSTHCVGMCGPLAIWASGTVDSNRTKTAINTSLYHLGRFATYCLVGVCAGTIGGLVNFGGESIGLRMLAARIVGTTMVLLGLYRLAQLFPAQSKSIPDRIQPSLITKLLVKLRPFVFRLPSGSRALVTGLLTAFLPCGWLYVFAFVAAGAADPVTGALVMFAFWLGTLPLLIGLVVSVNLLSKQFRMAIPIAASVLLVMTGIYTASGNGFASPNALTQLKADVSKQEVENLRSVPLPCCSSSSKDCETP